MTEHHRVPVGFFTPEGVALRTVELEADRIASEPEGSSSAESQSHPDPALVVHRTLYHAEGATQYVVHSVIEQRYGGGPLLARLQTYGSLTELMMKHPDLARSAAYAASAGLEVRERGAMTALGSGSSPEKRARRKAERPGTSDPSLEFL